MEDEAGPGGGWTRAVRGTQGECGRQRLGRWTHRLGDGESEDETGRCPALT